MGESMRLRSGLSEGLDVTLRLRKLADAMEFHDWMAQDVAPMHAALDEIWTRWDQDGVRLANDVAGKCMDLLVSRERVILNSGYGSRTMVHGIDCGCGGSAAGS